MEFGNIGVFLCSCGKTLKTDFRKISKDLEKLDKVAVVQKVERLCTEDGLAYIVDDLRRKDLDKAEEMGLEPLGVEIVNIREECAWVHDDKKAATEKAKTLLKASVNKEPRLPEIVDIEASESILIAGDIRALDLAEGFADFNVDIRVLTEDPHFERIPLSTESYLPSSKGSIFEFQDAVFHTNSRILDIKGDLGDFTVELEKGRHIDILKCVDCGKCIEVCEPSAISKATDSISPSYVISDKCTVCGECQKVCPTGAVILDITKETLNVGQVISFYPLKPREGVYVVEKKGGEEAAQRAAFRAAQNIKGYKKEKFINSEIEKCANHHIMGKKLDLKGCTFCVGSCSYYDVSSGVVSDLACMGCGSCATSCPQKTFDLSYQSFEDLLRELENTADAKIKPRIIMFTCSEGGYSTIRAAGLKQLKYPPAIPIIVPCLGNVSELHILRALDLGADGVVLLGCGSEACMYGDRVSSAKKVLSFFGIGKERVRMMSADGTDPEKFTRQLKDFQNRLKTIGTSQLAKKGAADLEPFDEKGSLKRSVLHSLLSSFSLKTGVKEGRIEEALGFGLLKVNEKECTLCGSCVHHCNADAFRYEGKNILDIYSTHSYCIGCGICAEICPENAIGIDSAIDLATFLERKEIKFDVPLIECAKCGTPLMAEAALKKLKTRLQDKELDLLQKCQACLDRETVADILKADEKSEDLIIIQQGKAPWER
jgi:heterodisulfide reductase subunit A-like polyferredoxin/coenzyme F420-reducing hydrogenase delta subunit